MGLETVLNFQQVGGKIASTGDFVLIASEVNPAIKTLQQHGIVITALHNQMLDDSPHLFFSALLGTGRILRCRRWPEGGARQYECRAITQSLKGKGVEAAAVGNIW
jgi:hypothetical protein